MKRYKPAATAEDACARPGRCGAILSDPVRRGRYSGGGFAALLKAVGMRYCEYCERLTMPTPKLTNEILTAAIDGYEFQKTRIDAKIAELRAVLDGGTKPTAATPEPPKRKRRKISAAGRKAIAEAQRKRWAESKKAAEPAPQEPPKPKRRISKAGMARIVAATKERWARVRAAKAQQEKAAKKAARQKATVKKAVKKSAAKKTATAAQTATEAAVQ